MSKESRLIQIINSIDLLNNHILVTRIIFLPLLLRDSDVTSYFRRRVVEQLNQIVLIDLFIYLESLSLCLSFQSVRAIMHLQAQLIVLLLLSSPPPSALLLMMKKDREDEGA